MFIGRRNKKKYIKKSVDKDKFAIKTLTGYFIQFETDINNKVTGLTFMQPNGNFKAVKKEIK